MWISQIFGAFAIVCSLLIYSRKERNKLLIFKCVQDACWLIHYLLLGAYPAVATSGLCICRSIMFYGTPREKEKSKWILVMFLLLYVGSAVVTWKNTFSILPAISSAISTVAFWMKKTEQTKSLAILASLVTLSYNVMVTHSVAVYVGVTFTVTTALLSLLLSIKKEKRAAKRQ